MRPLGLRSGIDPTSFNKLADELEADKFRRKTPTVSEVMPIRIQLNGDPRELPAPLHVAALLEHLGLDPRTVAVERNRAVVRRADYPATPVNDGDAIEVVAFVGGG